MVEKFESWKQEQADVLLIEEVEDLRSSGIALSDDDFDRLKGRYDDWIDKETKSYRDMLESDAFSL